MHTRLVYNLRSLDANRVKSTQMQWRHAGEQKGLEEMMMPGSEDVENDVQYKFFDCCGIIWSG